MATDAAVLREEGKGGTGMTDYSEPLSDAPAQLSRLTVLLATRRWVDALAIVDGMLRRLQTVRDWLVVRVEGEK